MAPLRSLAAALLVLSAGTVPFPTPAFAAATADTGAQLLRACEAARSGSETAEGLKCTAYLIGLFDGLRTLGMNSRDRLICPPQGIQDERFAQAYVAWAQANPQQLGSYPVAGALEALIQAFPCGRTVPESAPPRRR